MIHSIYVYGSDFLRKKVENVDLNDATLSSTISDMFETMHNANGAGLAANQIGINKRIIVAEEEISDGETFKGVFINPNILSYEGYLYSMKEGCLSFPGLKAEVSRPFAIEVEWYDEKAKYHKELFTGLPARILQHEIDHLKGILFIDKISLLDRLEKFMQLEDIKNKKVKTSYPII